eukprot:scaffold5987_cov203-Amphora_coffeaeformis.AAC.7
MPCTTPVDRTVRVTPDYHHEQSANHPKWSTVSAQQLAMRQPLSTRNIAVQGEPCHATALLVFGSRQYAKSLAPEQCCDWEQPRPLAAPNVVLPVSTPTPSEPPYHGGTRDERV